MATTTHDNDLATKMSILQLDQSGVHNSSKEREPDEQSETNFDRDNSDDTSDDGEDNSAEDNITLKINADADSIIGVSIGRAQTDLKSPTTPAATKAQVLNASSGYFSFNDDGQTELFEEPLQKDPSVDSTPPAQHGPKSKSEPVPKATPRPSSPPRVQVLKEQQKAEKRSSLVSTLLGSTNTITRPRSSSGSMIVENIRKRLPALPSISLPKLSGSNDGGRRVLGPAGPGVMESKGHESAQARPGHSRTKSQEGGLVKQRQPTEPQKLKTDVDATPVTDADLVSPRKPLIRRATSDQSLYLRRAATGASTFDDYTIFANVTDMENSRFKAITDSFQESSLRRPRLLSINRGSGQNTPRRAPSDETKVNTRINTGSTTRTETMMKHRSPNPPSASTSKHPLLKEALSRMSGDLVIMGGYRGSILREAQAPHRQLWVPIKVGMNLRKADLEVGLTREDELKMEEKIIPDGTLSHIGPVDICRRLLRKCRRCPNVQSGKLKIHDYGYDWRLSPDLLSDKLIQFLESLPCNQPDTPTGERGAWMVSHSLGGLITRHVANRRPDLIAGIVYAGTPQNCVNILGPLRNGDDVLFSSRVLTAQVNFTLRTSYALLPRNGRCFINKQTGERYDIDFFDVKAWDEYRLSPCVKVPLHRNNSERRTSLIGSISDVITQPSRHLSWLTFTNEDRGGNNNSTTQQVKEKADNAVENIAQAAETAKPERPLSPTMVDGSSQQHKPSIATQCTIPLPQATEYLSRTLASVLQFKEELSHRPSLQARNAYPPAAVLFAKNTPTVYGAFVTSREAIKYDDAFDDLAFAAGDGVVLASAAQLPAGYRCVRNGRIESDRGHVGLLGDLEGVGRCLNAVFNARARGVGTGACKETDHAQELSNDSTALQS